jgi:hypothetical protein
MTHTEVQPVQNEQPPKQPPLYLADAADSHLHTNAPRTSTSGLTWRFTGRIMSLRIVHEYLV